MRENLKISVSSIAKGHLHAVSADEITNGLVIELLRLRYRLRQQKLETCNWLQQLYGRKWSKLMLNQIMHKYACQEDTYQYTASIRTKKKNIHSGQNSSKYVKF